MSTTSRVVKGVLIDITGTIHFNNQAIKGSLEGLRRLRASGIPASQALEIQVWAQASIRDFLPILDLFTRHYLSSRFASNNTKESSKKLISKLNKLGFDVQPHEMFTSLSACRDLVASRELRPLLLLEEPAREEFEGIPIDEPHNAVVVGLSPSMFRYDMLNKAFQLILNGAPLIAAHKGPVYAEKEGELSLGPGAFVTALEYSTGKTATVVGKPSRSFYELALKDIGCLEFAQNVVMIGDDIRSDFGHGAVELGLIRYLVKTGKYREGDESRIGEDGVTGVDGVFENFGSAVEHIIHEGSAA